MGRMGRAVLGAALGGWLLAACGTSAPPAAVPTVAAPAMTTLAEWRQVTRDLTAAAPAAAQAEADAVWQALVAAHRVPLVFDDQVIFLYKGAAQSVVWRGVFSNWGDGTPLTGRRLGETDLWVAQLAVPAGARIEYKVVRDDTDWLQDPGNPATVPSGETTNSLLVLPGFTTTDCSTPQPGVPAGTLTANIPLAGKALGYTVNYRVYTPPGYASLSKLPVFYVLDGSDFIDPRMGAMPIVLDNLLAAGRIHPVIAVFVDPHEPGNPSNNRREDEFLSRGVAFARFVATELVPAVDAHYRTDPRPDARIIQGVSYGGLAATYIAASQSTVFHNLAALSPSYWTLGEGVALANPAQTAGVQAMAPAILAVLNCGPGQPHACLPLTLFLSHGVPEWDVGDFTADLRQLQRDGYAVTAVRLQEGHAWSAWRGVLDEMLTTFVGCCRVDAPAAPAGGL